MEQLRKSHYEALMREALAEAGESWAGEIPVGAIALSGDGKFKFSAHNTREQTLDVSGHAELNVLRMMARATGTWKLDGATLISTLEPCPMCAFAAAQANVKRLVFGAFDDTYGSAGSVLDLLRGWPTGKRVEVISGVLESDCSKVISTYFHKLRRG